MSTDNSNPSNLPNPSIPPDPQTEPANQTKHTNPSGILPPRIETAINTIAVRRGINEEARKKFTELLWYPINYRPDNGPFLLRQKDRIFHGVFFTFDNKTGKSKFLTDEHTAPRAASYFCILPPTLYEDVL